MSLNGIALRTLTRREVVRFFRIWSQTLLPSPISIGLYLIIFGKIMGAHIGQVDNYPYILYITPGLIMMAVINNAFSNVVSSFFNVKFHRNIEEMLVSPMPNWTIILGFVIGGTLRGCLVGALVIGLVTCFTVMPIYHIGVIFFVMVATATLFSLAGLINGIFARKFDDINFFPTFILTPLIYLGGVFYSVKVLSPFWKTLSYCNPILYLVNAFRYGFLGISDVSLRNALCFLLLWNGLLFCVSWGLLSRGVGVRN